MRRILTLAAATLALAACGDDAATRLARAERSFAAHDFRRAQIDIAAILQARPTDPRALELAARSFLAQGDGVAAQGALDKLARTGRKPADFALLAGESALLRGQAKEAVELVAGENSAEAWRQRAVARIALDDPTGAAAALASGEKADGSKARLLADWARLRLRQGDLAGAARLADRALGAGPAELDPLLAGAEVAAARGDLKAALERYDRAITAYPNSFAALTGKAAVLGDLGRTKELATLADRLGKTAPGEPQTAYLLARLAAERKDWNKVRTILQPIESSLEGRDEAQVLYAQAQLALGQEEQARARLEPLVRRQPGNTPAVLALARAQLAGGDAAAAVTTLKSRAARPEAPREVLALMAEATRAAGDPAAAQYAARARYPTPQALAADLARGDAALRRKDWQHAAEAYRRILSQTDGRSVLVLNNYAFAQQQLGNRAEALRLALRALKLEPDNASVMDTAGWLLVETGGDRNRALDLLRAASRKAPGNATIAAHLAAAERG